MAVCRALACVQDKLHLHLDAINPPDARFARSLAPARTYRRCRVPPLRKSSGSYVSSLRFTLLSFCHLYRSPLFVFLLCFFVVVNNLRLPSDEFGLNIFGNESQAGGFQLRIRPVFVARNLEATFFYSRRDDNFINLRICWSENWKLCT